MRGLTTFRPTRILASGHAFMQNLRRGQYDLATDAPPESCFSTAGTTNSKGLR